MAIGPPTCSIIPLTAPVVPASLTLTPGVKLDFIGLLVIVVIPTFNFLGSVLIEFGSNLGKRLLFDPNLGLNRVNVPDSTNLALYKVNFKS